MVKWSLCTVYILFFFASSRLLLCVARCHCRLSGINLQKIVWWRPVIVGRLWPIVLWSLIRCTTVTRNRKKICGKYFWKMKLNRMQSNYGRQTIIIVWRPYYVMLMMNGTVALNAKVHCNPKNTKNVFFSAIFITIVIIVARSSSNDDTTLSVSTDQHCIESLQIEINHHYLNCESSYHWKPSMGRHDITDDACLR